MITDEDLSGALDRIARTPDGELLYLYLQRTLMGVLSDPAISDGALLQDNGRRRLASELMAHMGKGIRDSGGRTEQSEPGRERPVTFAVREPARVGGRQSAREFLAASDPELSRASTASGTGGS